MAFNLTKSIKEKLRQGDYNIIVDRINSSGQITVKYHQVAQLFNGRNVKDDHIIYMAAIRLIEERNMQEKELIQQMEKMSS